MCFGGSVQAAAPFFFFHRNSGIVPYFLIEACKCIEYGCFARIRVSNQRYFEEVRHVLGTFNLYKGGYLSSDGHVAAVDLQIEWTVKRCSVKKADTRPEVHRDNETRLQDNPLFPKEGV